MFGHSTFLKGAHFKVVHGCYQPTNDKSLRCEVHKFSNSNSVPPWDEQSYALQTW